MMLQFSPLGIRYRVNQSIPLQNDTGSKWMHSYNVSVAWHHYCSRSFTEFQGWAKLNDIYFQSDDKKDVRVILLIGYDQVHTAASMHVIM